VSSSSDLKKALERVSRETIFRSLRVSKDIDNSAEILLLVESEKGHGKVCS